MLLLPGGEARFPSLIAGAACAVAAGTLMPIVDIGMADVRASEAPCAIWRAHAHGLAS
jgi:hypothetical protein